MIFSVQKIWSPSFFFTISSISIRTKCFHLNYPPTLSIPSKWWVCLTLHISVNSCSPKWSVKSMLHSQLPHHHFWYASSVVFNLHWCYIFLWLQIPSDVSLMNYDCYLENLTFFFTFCLHWGPELFWVLWLLSWKGWVSLA